MDIKILEDLIGKTLSSVNGQVGDEEIIFITNTGERYAMTHYQDCCESVYVEDICGDWSDVIGSPILNAYESSGVDKPPKDIYDSSYTWTFYHMSTVKGTVTIRWYGTSSGYYSERVDFVKITDAGK